MTDIKNVGFLKHLRSESNMHIRHFSNGKLKASGKGLAFWFIPIGSSIAEVPTDDRELQFIVQGRSNDYQDVTIQGDIVYRVMDPDCLADRVDFSINIESGLHRNQPIEQLSTLFSGIVQKHAVRHISIRDIKTLLGEGPDKIQRSIEQEIINEPVFTDMGLKVVSLGVKNIKTVPEVEKAMQTPTRERIQQNADEAIFQRRAMAVEKERAIADNELQNKIELATREEKLITQQGANERRRIEEEVSAEETKVKANIHRARMEAEAQVSQSKLKAETDSERQRILSQSENKAKRLGAETEAQNRRVKSAAEAEARRVEGKAEAEALEAIGLANAVGEKERMKVYETLPPNVVFALALQEIAGKLQTIEHINITPDILKTNLADLFGAGAQALTNMGAGK